MPRQHRCGPDRARDETAGAVGTAAMETIFDTCGAESAFIAADAGFGGAGRKIAVAAFAVGSKLQHGRVRWLGLDAMMRWGFGP